MLLKSLAILSSACILSMASQIAVADSDHQHDHGSYEDKAYQLVLTGDAGFGEACYLGVLEEGLTAAGLYYAVVETSFEHDDEGPGILLVESTQNQALVGYGENGSLISIQLRESGTTVADALQYAVRWPHEGHFDVGRCTDLTLADLDHDHDHGH